jgi:DTW domain-containing protein YfiP
MELIANDRGKAIGSNVSAPRPRRRRNDPIDPHSFEPRPMCYECNRPQSHCTCNLIEPFDAHCRILILQHFHERKKYYGTAKLVARGIRNCTLLRGIVFDEAQLEITPGTYLLYPSPTAVDVRRVSLGKLDTVIVIDGTWDEAAKILFNNPVLKRLPCLTFDSNLRSMYRIRKQPKPGYLSTIESVAHFLSVSAQAQGLDPSLYDRLMNGFNAMVERQLAYVPTTPVESKLLEVPSVLELCEPRMRQDSDT